MTQSDFAEMLRESLPVGTVFQNPGGGISKVVSHRDGVVSYRRGASNISVSANSLFVGYITFRGNRMSSSELRDRWPAIFDSSARPAGHSCNATFLFLALAKMELSSSIKGRG